MAISTAMATSFKSELMSALHNFDNPSGNTFKIALYTSSATLGASTTAYSSSNEVASTGNYSAGGNTLTSVSPTTSGTTAFVDFADTTWSSSTITANGALIYNNTNANRAAGQLNLAATLNNYWQVTGVQLEAGAVSTPFEFDDYEITLLKCQRYYENSYNDGTAIALCATALNFLSYLF
jgi:hypothetical protein